MGKGLSKCYTHSLIIFILEPIVSCLLLPLTNNKITCTGFVDAVNRDLLFHYPCIKLHCYTLSFKTNRISVIIVNFLSVAQNLAQIISCASRLSSGNDPVDLIQNEQWATFRGLFI